MVATTAFSLNPEKVWTSDFPHLSLPCWQSTCDQILKRGHTIFYSHVLSRACYYDADNQRSFFTISCTTYLSFLTKFSSFQPLAFAKKNSILYSNVGSRSNLYYRYNDTAFQNSYNSSKIFVSITNTMCPFPKDRDKSSLSQSISCYLQQQCKINLCNLHEEKV